MGLKKRWVRCIWCGKHTQIKLGAGKCMTQAEFKAALEPLMKAIENVLKTWKNENTLKDWRMAQLLVRWNKVRRLVK